MEDIAPEIREFLSAFRARPGMYTGHDGMITELRLFIDGMRSLPLIRRDRGKVDIIPYEFHDFTAKYYGESSSSMGWCNIILSRELDERIAFEKFWELLDECLVSGGFEPLKKIEPVPTEYERSDTTDHVLYCDLAALADSFCRVYERDRIRVLSRFRDLYRTPGFYGLAIWRDNFPVGAVIGNVEKTDEGDIYRISELWVIPEERHKGHAGQLLKKLHGVLPYRGVRSICAAVDEQGAAVPERFGFSDGGSLRVMELPVAPFGRD